MKAVRVVTNSIRTSTSRMQPLSFYQAIKMMRQLQIHAPFSFKHKNPVNGWEMGITLVPPHCFIPAENWDEYMSTTGQSAQNDSIQ